MTVDTIRTGDPVGGGWNAHAKTLVKLLTSLKREHMPLRAVEVGVFRGETSAHLLQALPDLYLWMVDPWKAAQDGDEWKKSGDRIAKLGQDEMDAVFNEAHNRTAFAEYRRSIFREPSVMAATLLADALKDWPNLDGFDLCFIDAEHSYTACKADIAAWWPLVRKGGILAGHDYQHRRYKGVTQAVDEWASLQGLQVTAHRGKVWSVLKP